MLVTFPCGFHYVLSDDVLAFDYIFRKLSNFDHSIFKGDLLPFLLACTCLCDSRKQFGLIEIGVRRKRLMSIWVDEDGLFYFGEMFDGFVEHIYK